MPRRATFIFIMEPIRELTSMQWLGLPHFVSLSQFIILFGMNHDQAFFHDLTVLER